MRSPALVLATGALLWASPLLAQRHDGLLSLDDMKKVRPNSCAIADSLAGGPLPRPTQPARGWRRGATNNLISNDVFALTGKKPIDGIILTATSQGEGPHPDATYALQLRLRDTLLRDGATARLSLTFDNTLTAEIGDMLGEPTPFEVPRRTLETFRAVFIGASCGERL